MNFIRSVNELLTSLKDGKPVNYLFFWGHRPGKGGAIGATCISQWYAQSFTHEGVFYATAEHFMMAGKARLFADEAALAEILASDDPGKVKAIGRKIKNYDDARWCERALLL